MTEVVLQGVLNMLKEFWREQTGLTTVEYALLLALIVVVAFTAWNNLGTTVENSVTAAGTELFGS